MGSEPLTTNVYVDGFNFYNGLFKGGKRAPEALKWVDLEAMALRVWPLLGPIHRVRYFTAIVTPPPHNPQMATRQQMYIRALTARNVDIHYGQFKLRERIWLLKGGPRKRSPHPQAIVTRAAAYISKFEEKGTDVSLASYLVRDVAIKDCDTAIVVSNDSDLAEAIHIARRDFGAKVYVVNPHRHRAAARLRLVANDLRELKVSALAQSQLPTNMVDAVGAFNKPPAWV